MASAPKPLVSIVVPVHNAAPFLEATLATLAAQTYRPLEIVLWDDASTDPSPAMLAAFAERVPSVTVYRSERSLGGYGAMNAGVRRAQGEFVAIYHADDLYDPTIVAREAERLHAEPDLGAVFCLDRFIDDDDRVYHHLTLPPELAARTRFDGPALTAALLRYKNTFLRTPSVMFRKAAFDAVGGFDQERYGIAADVDCWLRLAQHAPIGLIPEHLYSYRHHAAQWSRVYERLRTAPELFFSVMARHLDRPGVRDAVPRDALTAFRVWEVKDEAERAANLLVLGDRAGARALLGRSWVRPLLSSSPSRVLRILALRALVRAASGPWGRWGGVAVYLARFRRLPPRNATAPAESATHTLATAAHARAPGRRRPGLAVFLDPFSPHFYGDGIFDRHSKLNRDDYLRPWFHLRERLAERGIALHTADYLFDGSRRAEANVYVSFGIRDRLGQLVHRDDVLLTAFYLFEVMVVAPDMYRAVPDLQRHFRTVYAWTNAANLRPFVGDAAVAVSPFTIPVPHEDVIEPLWSRAERAGIALIAGNKRAALPEGELYTERLRAIRHFAGRGLDLWGTRWDEGLGEGEREFGDAVRRAYRGPAVDKYEVLSRYRFAICYENMVMNGWITEKLFDCFVAGVVPVYWGAPEIAEVVPSTCFIDRRAFAADADLERHLAGLTDGDLARYRNAARAYLASAQFDRFRPRTFASRFLDDIQVHLRERGLGHLWG